MTDTEKAALERRIDELCAEVERLHADQAHWELGNCPSCPNVADLQEALDENAKLVVKLNVEHIVRQNVEIENTELREEWREYQAIIDSLVDECTDHKAENAKLREFAGQVLYFTTMTDGCGDNCPYSSSDCRHECYLREQGRELGIEVDE